MRMTTKLVCLLMIMLVSIKFSESAQLLLSIHGDKGFVFDEDQVEEDAVVGFMYNDVNGEFLPKDCEAVTNGAVAGDLYMEKDCIAKAGKNSGAKVGKHTAKIGNLIVGPQSTNSPVLMEHSKVIKGDEAIIVPGDAVEMTASNDNSEIFCNDIKGKNGGKTFFEVDESEPKSDVNHAGKLKFADGTVESPNLFPTVLKCYAKILQKVKTSGIVTGADATFIMIITKYKDERLNYYLMANYVRLQQSIKHDKSGAVGYIDGQHACPANGTLKFAKSSENTCKGEIKVKNISEEEAYLTFEYNTHHYYAVVINKDNKVACFAINFKYSKILIGMLVISILKMLKRYSIQSI